MRRKITSLLLSVALVLLAVFFLNNEKVVDAADDMVLLEKRHPGYWEYLSPWQGKTILIPPVNSKNLLISDIQSQEQSGVTLTVNENHSITLNGENTSGEVINFVLGNVVLSDGEYFLSDSADSAFGVDIFVWANDLNKTVAYGDNAVLPIDNNISSYHCGIHIDPGAVLDNVVVYPMIRNSGDNSYSPYLSSKECDKTMVFEVDKGNIDAKDIKVLENYLSQYSDYRWISLKFPDNTGIQWKNGKRTEGNIDIWGRV